MSEVQRKSKAMVLERPGHFVAESFEVPQTGPDEFLLCIELVTICGGDLIEYQGGNRKAKYPLLMGHELVGRVEAVGEKAAEVSHIRVGDRVMVEPYIRCGTCAACVSGQYHFCVEGRVYGVTIPSSLEPHLWGAYSQYMYGAPGARVHRIDERVPARAAALTSVMANAVRWVRRRGAVQTGEGVLITGFGVQALSSIIVAKLAGAFPIVVAGRAATPERQALAREYGADFIYDTSVSDDSFAAELQAHNIRVAIECTGAENMYQVATDALQPMGRLVAVGTLGGQLLGLDLDAVVFKELDILGGLGQAGDTEFAAEIVNSRRFAIEKMVSHVLPLAEAEAAIQLYFNSAEDVIHVGLDPWAE